MCAPSFPPTGLSNTHTNTHSLPPEPHTHICMCVYATHFYTIGQTSCIYFSNLSLSLDIIIISFSTYHKLFVKSMILMATLSFNMGVSGVFFANLHAFHCFQDKHMISETVEKAVITHNLFEIQVSSTFPSPNIFRFWCQQSNDWLLDAYWSL